MRPNEQHYIIVSFGGIYEYIMVKSDIGRLVKRRNSILLKIEDRTNIEIYFNRITIENPTDEQIREVLNGIVSLSNYKREMKKSY